MLPFAALSAQVQRVCLTSLHNMRTKTPSELRKVLETEGHGKFELPDNVLTSSTSYCIQCQPAPFGINLKMQLSIVGAIFS